VRMTPREQSSDTTASAPLARDNHHKNHVVVIVNVSSFLITNCICQQALLPRCLVSLSRPKALGLPRPRTACFKKRATIKQLHRTITLQSFETEHWRTADSSLSQKVHFMDVADVRHDTNRCEQL
jgi:hypothetical protein